MVKCALPELTDEEACRLVCVTQQNAALNAISDTSTSMKAVSRVNLDVPLLAAVAPVTMVVQNGRANSSLTGALYGFTWLKLVLDRADSECPPRLVNALQAIRPCAAST
eukprot:3573997-Amphidinium_carterae.1